MIHIFSKSSSSVAAPCKDNAVTSSFIVPAFKGKRTVFAFGDDKAGKRSEDIGAIFIPQLRFQRFEDRNCWPPE